MLENRAIPVLLLRDGGLVKTVTFENEKYVGDPLNAVRLFNEKEVDELIVIDIDASDQHREPDFDLLDRIASECFMPLCYAGGIKTFEQAQRLFSMGIEKVAFGSSAVDNISLLQRLSDTYGAQSVIGIIDVKRHWLSKKPHVTHGKRSKKTNFTPEAYAKHLVANGVGEILLHDTDREGTQKGYDIDLIKSVTQAVDIPVIALGGAATVADLGKAIKEGGASAAAAGSLFVFEGVHRAVLIDYPSREQLRKTFTQ